MLDRMRENAAANTPLLEELDDETPD